ncbi:MAG TPA: hypothetical protein VGR31_12150 [Planctomycetota bacterium]|jgi:hypothetical protein|nr:hypothetical protein [Planctomycetota bacterium]
MRLATLIVVLLTLLHAGCSSTSSRIGRLYQALQTDVAERPAGAFPDEALMARHAARAKEVREIVDAGALKTTKEKFQAAVLLVETNDLSNLKLAEQLANEATLGGEHLGPRVAAEAIDKQLMVQHQPQRYGTQYEWVVALGEWRLYPLDLKTTDAERALVGVPPLAELYAGERKLNSARTIH